MSEKIMMVFKFLFHIFNVTWWNSNCFVFQKGG